MTTTTVSGVDVRALLLVHDALRREYRWMPDLVRAVHADDTSRLLVVAEHVRWVGRLLRHHHEVEQRLLWPALLPRLAGAGRVVRRIEERHTEVLAADVRAGEAVALWCAEGSGRCRDSLADALEAVGEVLVAALALEEAELLPLARRHLTPTEWVRLGEQSVGGLDPRQLPLVMGLLMHQADPEVIRGLLGHAPLRVRRVLPQVAPRARDRYVRHVYGGTDLSL